jgi:hypothetical protein
MKTFVVIHNANFRFKIINKTFSYEIQLPALFTAAENLRRYTTRAIILTWERKSRVCACLKVCGIVKVLLHVSNLGIK